MPTLTLKNPLLWDEKTFEKVIIVDEAQGERNAETEIVHVVQRGCEYRATQQFAARSTFAKVL